MMLNTLANLKAIGTDNASNKQIKQIFSVMICSNNSVCAQLKSEISTLILIRCTCRSTQLATSCNAIYTLPRNLNFIISKTHKWFTYSAVWQSKYKNLYQTLNDGSNPLKIPREYPTRWLSIQPAVQRILDQWLKLKTHFELTRLSE